MQPLEKIRKQIDSIDDEILNKLSERFRLAIKLSRFKAKIRDNQREKEVLFRVKRKAAELPPLRPEFSVQIFRLIIEESRFTQEKITQPARKILIS